MFPVKILSPAEFASLSELGAGLVLGAPPVPIGHISKLLRLNYIGAVDGGFEATPAGMLRIASGS